MRELIDEQIVKILRYLSRNDSVASTELIENLEIPQASVYRKLRKLRKTELVEWEKERHNFINPEKIEQGNHGKRKNLYTLSESGRDFYKLYQAAGSILEQNDGRDD